MKNSLKNMISGCTSQMNSSFIELIQVSQAKILGTTVLFLLVITACVDLQAQSYGHTATQLVTLEVKPISKISVAGSSKSLIIRDDANGSDITSISDENTKYSLSAILLG